MQIDPAAFVDIDYDPADLPAIVRQFKIRNYSKNARLYFYRVGVFYDRLDNHILSWVNRANTKTDFYPSIGEVYLVP